MNKSTIKKEIVKLNKEIEGAYNQLEEDWGFVGIQEAKLEIGELESIVGFIEDTVDEIEQLKQKLK